jgi:hypothetical protein
METDASRSVSVKNIIDFVWGAMMHWPKNCNVSFKILSSQGGLFQNQLVTIVSQFVWAKFYQREDLSIWKAKSAT